MASSKKKQNPPPASSVPAVKKKRKRKKKKHPILFTIFLIFITLFMSALMTIVIVGGSVYSYVNHFVNGDKDIDLDFYKSEQSQTSILYAYDEDGTPIEQQRLHGEENRIWIDYKDIPDNLIWAFVCLEDKR